MAIDRSAHATWEGDLKSGSGQFDLTSSQAITGEQVTFASRFEPVCREQPTIAAAAAVVTPEPTSTTSRRR